MQFDADPRIVMTWTPGGRTSSFRPSRPIGRSSPRSRCRPTPTICRLCLAAIVEGFTQVRQALPETPVAISFAFPGPADYPAGIIGDLGNLPGFRGGVALGPMLEDRFQMPVFINNDGDLFAYGEAISGFLPYINEKLKAGRQREAVPQPVRHHAGHGLRRRHRPQRRAVPRRQRGRRRNLAHARQTAPAGVRRGGRQHPRRPAGLFGPLAGEARQRLPRPRRFTSTPAARATATGRRPCGPSTRWARPSAMRWPTPSR